MSDQKPTPFDDVDVDADGLEAPSGDSLTDAETAEIKKQVAAALAAGSGQADLEEGN